ncbi:MAG TPA: glycoside hydrolase family 43 protein [Fodinibius sp.]|nr:glycoside hydrolase family 43 protein [Fodinibius sp.]
MKLTSIIYIGLVSVWGFFSAQQHSIDLAASNPNPGSGVESSVFFGDPFILLDDGTYYMYGTHNSDTGIEVYQSDNLEEWEGPIGARDGFALHENDVYGQGAFWAPEVYHINDKYYMFFSVEEHMAIAVSDHPEGPFVQEEPSVLRGHKSIDHHLFIDEDGTKYLYFANFKEGLEIWGAVLEDDFSSIREETLTRIISRSQDWEKSPKEPVGIVNEGPFVVKKDGKYYMTYSANHYASPDYGIGLAFAEQPLGNWTKSGQNPVIQNPGGLVGTGHSSFFEDKKGDLRIVYHAHFDTAEVHPRKVFINRAQFTPAEEGSRLTLAIETPGIEPKTEPTGD